MWTKQHLLLHGRLGLIMYLVSSCLLGIGVRIDFGDAYDDTIARLAKEFHFVPICSERYGGIALPCPPCEIVGGTGLDVINHKAKVLTKNGLDISRTFVRGAEAVYKMACLLDLVHVAILRSKSPSCGIDCTYAGNFDGSVRKGDGVLVAYLRMKGFELFTETNLPKIQRMKNDFKKWIWGVR